MKKNILAAMAIMAIGTTMMNARNQTFTYIEEDEYGDVYPDNGQLRRVSPNGLWATGGDEAMETGSFIINTTDPDNIINTTYYLEDGTLESGLLLDINDEGMAVGTYYETIFYTKYKHAGIFKDGKWIRLPEPESTLGSTQAVAISADSKVIAGHAICENIEPDEPGRYFPVTWVLNEATGEYELGRLYNNIDVPGTYGFFVYDMTPDAKYICGVEPLDFGDVIGVILNTETGELKRFHDIEYKYVYFEKADGYFNTMFVDGLMDGFDASVQFNEMFIYATDRYIYGSRAIVSDVKEDGSGVISNYATIYDIEENKFIDGPLNTLYLCGKGTDIVFDNLGNITKDGVTTTVQEYVNTPQAINGVYSLDDAGSVLTGVYVGYTTFGEPFESPVLVLLDEESQLTSIRDVCADFTSDATVKVSGSDITVSGAQTVEVYDVAGQLVSTSATTTVNGGIYIVVADGTAHKVQVR